jgi:hypothetical protein
VLPNALFVRSLPLLLALSLLPAPAGAEGSTLSSEKLGACAVLTAADVQRLSNLPVRFRARAPSDSSPGRSCAYQSARSGSGRVIVDLRLLDAREWSRIEAQAGASKPEIVGIDGIGDEAYVTTSNSARRSGAVVVFVHRRTSQLIHPPRPRCRCT